MPLAEKKKFEQDDSMRRAVTEGPFVPCRAVRRRTIVILGLVSNRLWPCGQLTSKSGCVHLSLSPHSFATITADGCSTSQAQRLWLLCAPLARSDKDRPLVPLDHLVTCSNAQSASRQIPSDAETYYSQLGEPNV